GSGKPSITWPQSVDQALCFGWIDGVRKSIDAGSYKIRFTPRKPGSRWSNVNVKRVAELTRLGLMRSAGREAFDRRTAEGVYSSEQTRAHELEPAHAKMLRANTKAWAFFQSNPPWYRKAVVYWVVSAKQEATRLRRLTRLIEDSASGRTIRELTRKPKGSAF